MRGKVDPLREDCTFCAEIEGREDHNLLHELAGNDIGRSYILSESENFVVLPAVGALCPGYVLVVPREHVLSFGFLESDVDEELELLLEQAIRWHEDAYGCQTVMFEHGSSSFTERGGLCTDHAHLHLVPVTDGVDLLPGLRRDFEARPAPRLVAAARSQVQSQSGPYLYLRRVGGDAYICGAKGVSSQYLRRDLFAQCGLPHAWDWRAHPGVEHIRATIDTVAAAGGMGPV